jgi:hypothetical protein
MSGTRRLQWFLLAMFVTTAFISNVHAIALDCRVKQHGGWYVEAKGFDARMHESLFSSFPFAESEISTVNSAIDGTVTSKIITDSLYHFNPKERWGWSAALGYDFPTCSCCAYVVALMVSL